MGGSLKKPIFVQEKPVYRGGGLLKKGAWTVCRFKDGLGKKGEEVSRGQGQLQGYLILNGINVANLWPIYAAIRASLKIAFCEISHFTTLSRLDF